MLETAVLPVVPDDSAARRLFDSMIRNASDLVGICEADGRVRYISPSVESLLGFTPEEVLSFDRFDRIHPDDIGWLIGLGEEMRSTGSTVRAVYRVQHRDGTWRTFDNTITNLLQDPDVAGIVWNGRDVTDQADLESQLRYQSLHDPLTALPNRTLFEDRIDHALIRARRHGANVAVAIIDLDLFTAVNDSLGAAAGDRLLVNAASRLAQCLRPGDTLARLAGDEFAVVIEDIDGVDTTKAATDRLLAALRLPFRIEGHDIFITASAGIAVSVDGQERAVELTRNAHLATRLAKDRGGDRAVWFEDSMHRQLLDRTELASDLHHALDRGEFRLHYQPTVDVETGRIEGVEALLRWRHPTRGEVSPDVFIPIAEASGVIVPIGRWVTEEACRVGRIWQRRDPFFTLAVNLSPRQLQHPDIVADVGSALRLSGMPAANLVLEITETALVQDPDTARVRLDQLKSLGVRLAIDDFGTGYSSLAQLRWLPVDILKIDKSFVDGLNDPRGEAFVRAIVHLAHELGQVALAEGVEEVDQLDALRRIGCDAAQGFLFARPTGASNVEQLLCAQATPMVVNGRSPG